MADYVLSCCSTADLTEAHFLSRDIHTVPFHFELDGVSYLDDFGSSVPFDVFYQKMQEGADTKTSQVNAEEFEHYFETFLEQGLDILHVCLSSGLSGVMNSASIAKNRLMERYPDRTIELVDSLAASGGYGMLMDEMADLRDKGLSLGELKDWVERQKLHLHHWFFSTDLTFYIRGGRISKAKGFIGGMLSICPLLNMDDQGRLIPRQKIRTKKKVIKAMVAAMAEHADAGENYAGKCYLSHSACYEDARAVADEIEARFPHLQAPVEIYSVGTVIGSHTGPGTVALYFWGDSREKE